MRDVCMAALILLAMGAGRLLAEAQALPLYVGADKPDILVRLWESEKSAKTCIETWDDPSAEPPVCVEGTVAMLTSGTAVTRRKAAECGQLPAVTVTGGKHKGKVGCVDKDKLQTARPK